METLTKITSHESTDGFYWWLSENPTIDSIQGFPLTRRYSGTVALFGSHIFDHNYIWDNRKMLNDWIDKTLKQSV